MKSVSIKKITHQQLTPGQSISNRKAIYASRSARVIRSSGAATVVSEPYWSLAKSDSESVCSTKSASWVQVDSSRNLEAACAQWVRSTTLPCKTGIRV